MGTGRYGRPFLSKKRSEGRSRPDMARAAVRERLALVWTLGAEPIGPPPITIALSASGMPGVG